MELALSPHNDDVELFAAYALMRFRPFVVVCLRSFVQERQWGAATYQEREVETEEALEILGCAWMQLQIPDDDPDWDELRWCLSELAQTDMPERVWAPLPEPGGHYHHNMVGLMAANMFGPERVIHYSTYTHERGRTTTGVRQAGDASEEQQKRNALSRYQTQIADPRTRMHFERRPLDEFYSEPARSSQQVS